MKSVVAGAFMFRSPLTDYDTWACLTPGFLLLAAFDHVLNLGWIWRETWTTVGAIFAIACAYSVGHACASLASMIIERGLVHRILKPPSIVLLDPDAGPKWARRVFRNYYRALPPPAPQRVTEKAGIGQGSEAIFQWAYSVAREKKAVSERLPVFLNQYGMARNSTFAALICAALLTWSAVANGGDADWWWAAAAAATAVTMLFRFLKNYRLFTAEIYRHVAFEECLP
jgi:hypothetical protein